MNDMESVVLKPTSEDDFEDYYSIRSDPSDIYWNGYTSKPDKESFRTGFKNRTASARFEFPEDRRNYLIKILPGEISVGFIQLIMRKNAVEIGFGVSQPYQGKGYASSALRLGIVLARQFSHSILLFIRDDNTASQKVALHNGFRPTEIYREIEYPVAGRVKLREYILVENDYD